MKTSTIRRLILGAVFGAAGVLAFAAPAYADDAQRPGGALDTVVGVVDEVTPEPTQEPEPPAETEPADPEPTKEPDKAPTEDPDDQGNDEPAKPEDTPTGEPGGQDDDQGDDEPAGDTEPTPAPTPTPVVVPPTKPVEDVLDEVEDVVDEVLPTPTTPAPAPTPVVVPIPPLPTPAPVVPIPTLPAPVVTPAPTEPTQPTEPTEDTPLDAPASTNPPTEQLPRTPAVEVTDLPVIGPVAGSDTLLPGLTPAAPADTPQDREPQCDGKRTLDDIRDVARKVAGKQQRHTTRTGQRVPSKPCPTPAGPDGQAITAGNVKPPPPTGEQLIALTVGGAYSAPVLHRLTQLRPRGDIPAGRTEHPEPGPA